MQPPQLTIVGLGPGDPGLVTVAGSQALAEAEVVFVPRRRSAQSSLALRICEQYLDQRRQRIVTLPLVMERESDEASVAWDAAASCMAAELRPGTRAAYALLGDPLIYGSCEPIVKRLLAQLPTVEVRYLPGVPSFCAAAARIGEPLVTGDERLALLPGLYEEDATRLARLLDEFDTLAILKAGPNLPTLLRAIEARRDRLRVWLAERLGMPGEQIIAEVDEQSRAQAGYFSLAIVKQARHAQEAAPQKPGRVIFIGAGPGAPDLITLRGQAAIAQADAILYADSLVMEAIARWARPGARVIPTSGMHLDEMVALMREVTAAGGSVARVHSGDPSLYGAIHEQIQALESAQVAYEIIPGVTVAFAAAARLQTELTIPELTQSIILTRISGRASPVPERESLRSLAAHRASLAIYLAATRARQVQEELIEGGYPPETPVAICYRVEWPDEQIVRCRLDQLAEQMRERGFTRQTLILVSPALNAAPDARSRLYDEQYDHRFRNRRTQQARPAPPERRRLRAAGPAGQPPPPAVIAVSRAGSALAAELARRLRGTAYVPQRFAPAAADVARPYHGSVVDLLRELWGTQPALVLVMATGIAVRAIGALAADKRSDPPVVVCDDLGRSVISLLSGHLGGANRLAQAVAAHTGGQPILTTASELRGLPALDLLAAEMGWQLAPGSALTRAMAALVNNEPVGLLDPYDLLAEHSWPDNLVRCATPADLERGNFAATVVISDARPQPAWLERGAVLHPPLIAAGIGCRRETSPAAIEAALRSACDQAGVAVAALACLATVELKAAEPGLLACAEQCGLPLRIYSGDEIERLAAEVELSPSAASAHVGLPGVAEPCALLAAGTTRLLLAKQAGQGVTVALARKEIAHGG